MSASGQSLATAASQYRNGLISAMLNKADPFVAIAFAQNMLAIIPPQLLGDAEDDEDKMPQPPERKTDIIDDPDSLKFQKDAWKYCFEMSNWVERKIAQITYDQLSRLRSGG